MKSSLLPILVLLCTAFLSLMTGCAAGRSSAPAGPTPIPADGEITLNPSETFQHIEGFGASGAWWAQDVGGWEDTRDQIITLLFDPQQGIGLTIYRYNIGGGAGTNIPDAWRRAESFEVGQGVYDWTRDANAMWVLRAVRDQGVDHIIAFANTPPARITVSGLTNAAKNGQTNLTPEMYDQFAQYLVDIVRHLREQEGIPIGWISPINEPQWDWGPTSGQEGSHYTPEEAAAVTRTVISAFQASGMDVKFSVLDAGEWWNSTRSYLDPILSDPEIAPYIDHLGIHSYWSTRDDKVRLVNYLDKNHPGTRVAMTEWTEMVQGRNTRMDSAMVLANTVLEDLSVGQAISWQYWIAVSKYTFRDGLIYVALNDHEITETKRLWALGNFSRYIRPGAVRISAASDLNTLPAAAFQSPDGGQLILVVINNADKPATMRLTGIPDSYSTFSAQVTDAKNNLAETSTGPTPSVFRFSATSVTTLVFSDKTQ